MLDQLSRITSSLLGKAYRASKSGWWVHAHHGSVIVLTKNSTTARALATKQ